MIRPPKYIEVDPKDVKPNNKYQGYKKGKTYVSYCIITFDENLKPTKFYKYPLEKEELEGITCYLREMTYEEEEEWYENAVIISEKTHILNLMGLHNNLHSIGDAYHEMWNAWVETDWRRQLMNLFDENFFIIGIAPVYQFDETFRNPVAIVCETYDSGERFWCHAEKDWVEGMREASKIYYEALMQEE